MQHVTANNAQAHEQIVNIAQCMSTMETSDKHHVTPSRPAPARYYGSASEAESTADMKVEKIDAALSKMEKAGAAPAESKKTNSAKREQRSNKPKTLDLLLAIAHSNATLYLSADNDTYVVYQNKMHRECCALSAYQSYLALEYYKEEKDVASDAYLKAAISTLDSEAKYSGARATVYCRVGMSSSTGEVQPSVDGEVGEHQITQDKVKAHYLDLVNEGWQAIRISADGWVVENEPDVLFRRTSSMRALPMPVEGGELSKLWGVVNIRDEDRNMALAWLLECLRIDTPYVVLELVGEQGAAKSWTQSCLRDLIDPNKANNRAAPKSVQDIFVAAKNSHLVSYENVSHLPSQYQDALCVLATGAGFAARQLYTDNDEIVMSFKQPIVLNGISTNVTAQDLVDRTLHLSLPRIESRKTMEKLAKQFERDKGEILGGLLDLFVKALTILPTVEIAPTDLPRMADFAYLGEAVYRALGMEPGAFLKEYAERRKAGVQRILDASPVASAMVEYLDRQPGGFRGQVKELYGLLYRYAGDGDAWPKTVKGFADALRRASAGLRLMGIEAGIEEQRTKNGYVCALRRLPSDIAHPGEARSEDADDGGVQSTAGLAGMNGEPEEEEDI